MSLEGLDNLLKTIEEKYRRNRKNEGYTKEEIDTDWDDYWNSRLVPMMNGWVEDIENSWLYKIGKFFRKGEE